MKESVQDTLHSRSETKGVYRPCIYKCRCLRHAILKEPASCKIYISMLVNRRFNNIKLIMGSLNTIAEIIKTGQITCEEIQQVGAFVPNNLQLALRFSQLKKDYMNSWISQKI